MNSQINSLLLIKVNDNFVNVVFLRGFSDCRVFHKKFNKFEENPYSTIDIYHVNKTFKCHSNSMIKNMKLKYMQTFTQQLKQMQFK